MTFRTTQSDLTMHNGKKIIKKVPLDECKYEKEHVGPMFAVTLIDGTELEVFGDELQMKYDDFIGYDRIAKKEAREQFNAGVSVFVGGKSAGGEGAIWDVSQFQTDELLNFDEIASWFKSRYCSGVGRIEYMCFYTRHKSAGAA